MTVKLVVAATPSRKATNPLAGSILTPSSLRWEGVEWPYSGLRGWASYSPIGTIPTSAAADPAPLGCRQSGGHRPPRRPLGPDCGRDQGSPTLGGGRRRGAPDAGARLPHGGLARVCSRLGRYRRPPNPLPRVQCGLRRQPPHLPAEHGGAHRGSAARGAGREPANVGAGRRRAADTRDRGDARRPYVVHARGAARSALVGSAAAPRGGARSGCRAPKARCLEMALARGGPGGAPHSPDPDPADRVRTDRGVRADRPELAPA